jgi:TolA-binding protein
MALAAAPEKEVSPAAEDPRPRRRPVRAAFRTAAAWAKAHRLKAGLAALAAMLLLAAFLGIGFRLLRLNERGPTVTLEEVLAALDRGEDIQAEESAKRLLAQGTLAPEELGGPLFALGAATMREASQAAPRERGPLLLIASRYLEEALQRGFPPGREGEGLYLYGKCLYERGQISACRPVLFSAVKADPARQPAIHWLLAESYLHDSRPQLERALEQNTLYLGEKKLSAVEREEGLIQRGEILLQMGRVDECNAAAAQIREGSRLWTKALALRARALMHEAEALRKTAPSAREAPPRVREQYQAAIELLRQAQGYEANRPAAMREAMYLIGLCWEGMGDTRAALDQFIRTSGQYFDTPEGTAAGFRAAVLLGRLGRDSEALLEYRQTIESYSRTSLLRNPWLTASQLRTQLWNTFQQYLDRQQFKLADPYLALLKPFYSPERLLQIQAEFSMTWGQALINQAETASPVKQDYLRKVGRKQYRRAGASYTELARMFPASRQYTDYVWQGALADFQGRDFRRAAQMFKVYLKNEVQSRRPQALAYLGESQLALGRADAALETLRECISNYPRDVAASRARLLAAKLLQEKGQTLEARGLLAENLKGECLTPASKEWRESLMTSGELLVEEGKYDEAAERLEEYVQRYPNLPETLEARYLLGETCQRSALAVQAEMKKDLDGTSWGRQSRRIRHLLNEALEQYQAVEKKLAAVPNRGELTPRERALLRNCTFAVGDVLFAQREYEAAVKAYFTAANRYYNQPEALTAFEQISYAYRRLHKPQEAHNAIEQAKVALSRMKPNVSFAETSVWTRKQWEQRLESLSTL